MNVFSLLFNDFYQIKMAYSYWKNKSHEKTAVFSLYFRKNPFGGEFTIFTGLSRFLQYINEFRVTDEDVEFVKHLLGCEVEQEFFHYLRHVRMDDVEVHAIEEGTVVFPTVPLVQISGPLAKLQLMETPLLNFTNYASLVSTNAARFRIVAGPRVVLSEFGCRRAQGPDGALSASLYAYVGGFDSTSNTLASKLYGVPLSGTVAHSFVCSFSGSPSRCPQAEMEDYSPFKQELWKRSLSMLEDIDRRGILSKSSCFYSELEAFVGYAVSFPHYFMAIIDTYSVYSSGLPNFCAVALALHEMGFRANGVRIDSGDLAYLSFFIRDIFAKISQSYGIEYFSGLTIVASNEITLDSLSALVTKEHQIDVFGIGTHLVTCSSQPSLGMVYKLTEHDGIPTMKLSENMEKSSIPFKKKCYRLYGVNGVAIVDLLTLWSEKAPEPNERVLCIHSLHNSVKIYVIPTRVEPLHKLMFQNSTLTYDLPSVLSIRENLKVSISAMREDHIRIVNPTQYKVSLSQKLLDAFNDFKNKLPIPVIR